MKNLQAALKNHTVITVIGMTKNTGKTTALNRMMANSRKNGTRFAILSTGRDGENRDVFTQKAKPDIQVAKGDIFVTTRDSLSRSHCHAETIEKTKYRTSMGPVMIARAHSGGTAEIAGPTRADETVEMVRHLKNRWRARRVFVDGSINRLAIATSRLKAGLVLATGMALGPLSSVVEATGHQVEILQSPQASRTQARKILPVRGKEGWAAFKRGTTTGRILPASLLHVSSPKKSQLENIEWMYTPGAITDRALDAFGGQQPLQLVCDDASKIMVSARALRKWRESGNELRVLKKVELLAITGNPYHPLKGKRIPSERLLGALHKSLKIPVWDVVANKARA